METDSERLIRQVKDYIAELHDKAGLLPNGAEKDRLIALAAERQEYLKVLEG